MDYRKIRLIASDLDGTLLLEGAQELNPELFGLIRQLQKKGIHFVSASGRPYKNQYDLFSPVQDEIDYIAENGGFYFVNGKQTLVGEIPLPLAKEIILFIEEHEDCRWTATTDAPCFIRGGDKQFYDYVKNVIHFAACPIDSLDDLRGPITKVAVFSEQDVVPYVKPFSTRFPQVTCITSGNRWVDFIPKTVHKGRALLELSRKLHIAPDEIVAFGDQYNDIEMLQFAGTGYAMRTCAKGVESYADYLTDSVEDTLREILAAFP